MSNVLRGLLLLVLLVAAVMAKVVYSGEREIALSSEALRAGDAENAAVHARMAALWYTPGAPHVRVAYGRLMALGREAERRRLWDTALFSYRSVISASASTRWAVEPHATDVASAKEAIARIESRAAPSEPAEPVQAGQLDALAEPAGVAYFWTAALAASFAGMAGGLIGLLRRGLDESGRLDLRRGLLPTVVAMVGLVGYVAALLLA